MEKRKKTRFVPREFPDREPIVAMCEHNGRIYVASTRHVYRLNGDTLEQLEMIMEVPVPKPPKKIVEPITDEQREREERHVSKQ